MIPVITAYARVAAAIASEFLPVQAIRCVFDRDFERRARVAGAAADAAERLAEREAEVDVSEPAECPTGFYAGEDEWYCEGCNGVFPSHAEFAKHRYEDDEVPNPTEPSLTDDELVAARGLIQERYPNFQERYPNFAGAAASLADGCLSGHLPHEPQEPSVREEKQRTSGTSSPRSSAGPHPNSAAVPETTAAGGEAVSGEPPDPPASPRTPDDGLMVLVMADGRPRIFVDRDEGELILDPNTVAYLHDDPDSVTLAWPDTDSSATFHRGADESTISTPDWTIRVAEVVFGRIADGSLPLARKK